MSMHTVIPLKEEQLFEVIDPSDVRRSYAELTTLLHECEREYKRYARIGTKSAMRLAAYYRNETRETRAQLRTYKAILA